MDHSVIKHPVRWWQRPAVLVIAGAIAAAIIFAVGYVVGVRS